MKLIVAVGKNWEIGCENKLLFSLKKDMAFFRQTTTGSVVVMGRKTLLSFPNGPLKNRKNIVLSSSDFSDFSDGKWADDAGELKQVGDLNQLFAEIKDEKREVFVIGGASVYRTLLPYCTHALVTKVDACAKADTYFPNLDKLPEWVLTEQTGSVLDGDYSLKFTTYKNTKLQ